MIPGNMVGSIEIQDMMKGRHPAVDFGMYTIPQRDTVAGDALDRSFTSNRNLIVIGFSLILSPGPQDPPGFVRAG